MLTVMCPNCRHRFPAPGCCNPTMPVAAPSSCGLHQVDCGNYYGGGLLVPRGYTNGGGCIINAPTIIHGPAIIQSQPAVAERVQRHQDTRDAECHITTTCEMTGGSVTITTPSIQSGGCLIQSTDSGVLVQAPRIEVRPKLSGGGCLVQTQFSTDESDPGNLLNDEDIVTGCGSFGPAGIFQNPHPMLCVPPSGCQELPGTRRSSSPRKDQERLSDADRNLVHGCCRGFNGCHRSSGVYDQQAHSGRCNSFQEQIPCSPGAGSAVGNHQHGCCTQPHKQSQLYSGRSSLEETTSGAVIQVNATVQLPPNVGQCTVNITATTTAANCTNPTSNATTRSRNNFNGGGLVQPAEVGTAAPTERRDGAPTTPVSWLMPCPWGFDNYHLDKDLLVRLSDARRLLQCSGWYHEGLSWQQSEALLREAPVGRWLLRDSSDSRFTFAVSVQTSRGPTSVRVHYFLGHFRLDAEPRLALAMPHFDCPIKMLEYYVDYSKRMDEKREVWVDHSGQLYSQIYFAKPLVKEVRSLSHLARLAVNRAKIPTDDLPPLIRNYLAEYPYAL
ncbi:uncharacterized protein LOC107265591 [Cephus cinctus]|uniref:Uncharacterized protein LOC107265591 n=1 Tax=Cephus cinctus TaxID=211228 RepID=A0AAJ7RDS3_CEPCN|nr:uncharacterized protein LOC107265591 [Cephus cinctus]XP_015590673.1 uncharacterized protein LOC107265591 [Cephus cinctus]XP_024938671.1 uncharacterized protein LOC107265591 [Cephus cinctus]XP_024938672.1 uncharacterized protein LOC107265591 [Cephus cinctus]